MASARAVRLRTAADSPFDRARKDCSRRASPARGCTWTRSAPAWRT